MIITKTSDIIKAISAILLFAVLAMSCPVYIISQDCIQEKYSEMAEETSDKEVEAKESKSELFNSKENIFATLALNKEYEFLEDDLPETIWQKVITPPPRQFG